MGEVRSREPLERDSQGARILTHDRFGYGRGCGCDACRLDHAAYTREQRAIARGAEYGWAYTPRRRGRGPGRGDGLPVVISFRVTGETAAAIDALTPAGGTRNTTARDILLGALEAGQGEDNQREEGQQS
jgi:hypothetical protein